MPIMSELDSLSDVRGEATPVRDAARAFEPDRFLSALLAPKSAREDLVAIAAFIGELKRIPLLTKDAAIGEIRLQWWRDTLEARAAGQLSGHPVADSIIEVARRRSLPSELLLGPVEGFSRELYEDGVRDGGELDDYAHETEGAAIRLALAVLGGTDAGEVDRLVDYAARALALTRLALTLPQHIAQNRLPLPEEWITRTGDPRELPQMEARNAVRALGQLMADDAHAALDRYRRAQGDLRASLSAAFLPMCLIEPYLAAVGKPGRDALLEVAEISPLSRVTRLWFAHWRGKI
jgi:phytoene synthase